MSKNISTTTEINENDELQKALQSYQSGQGDIAENHCHKIITKNANNVDALHLLGIIYAQRKRYTEASKFLEKAISLNGYQASLHNSLGNVFKNIKDFKKAAAHYHEALKIDPHYAIAHNNLAIILEKLGEDENAINHYEKALSINPNYADALFNLGLISAKKGAFDEAINLLTKAKTINPNNARVLVQLGKLLQQQGQPEKAIKNYLECLDLDENNIDATHNLGSIYLGQGDLVLAEKYFNLTLQLDPENIFALQNLGAIKIKQNKLDEALKYYFAILEHNKNFNTYYNIGVIYMDQNRLDDALVFLREALAMNPEDFSTLSNIAAIFLKKENYPNAILYYEKALQIDPRNEEAAFLISALKQSQAFTKAPLKFVKNLFDQYAPYFDKHLMQQLTYQVPSLLFDSVNNLLHENVKIHKLNILDLGCGTGLVGEKFKPLADKLVGIDVSPQMLEVSRQKNIYDELKLIDLTAALKEATGYDLILAGDTLVYFGDLTEVFTDAYNALCVNGIFAFTLEKTADYPYQLQLTARFAHSEKYLNELIGKSGFKCQELAKIELRKHKGQPVMGLLIILRKR